MLGWSLPCCCAVSVYNNASSWYCNADWFMTRVWDDWLVKIAIHIHLLSTMKWIIRSYIHERNSNTKYINTSKNSSRLYSFSLIKWCPNALVQISHILKSVSYVENCHTYISVLMWSILQMISYLQLIQRVTTDLAKNINIINLIQIISWRYLWK